jgi:D-glycero-D-manno-heptose 1,7-bisphosphate phosphatase
MTLKNVIFLDRDGVINYDSSNYIKCWKEYAFLPGSKAAIADLTQAGYTLILITNQSIIGREMVLPAVLDDIHRRMGQAVADAGGRIIDIFYCPHHPNDHCDCRKPEPGLIFQAKEKHGIDLPQTIMIGDNAKDVLCGQNAGCGATILVRTGNGREAEQALAKMQIAPTTVTDDLGSAAQLLLSGQIHPTVA